VVDERFRKICHVARKTPIGAQVKRIKGPVCLLGVISRRAGLTTFFLEFFTRNVIPRSEVFWKGAKKSIKARPPPLDRVGSRLPPKPTTRNLSTSPLTRG
jgi:hypothetical protein